LASFCQSWDEQWKHDRLCGERQLLEQFNDEMEKLFYHVLSRSNDDVAKLFMLDQLPEKSRVCSLLVSSHVFIFAGFAKDYFDQNKTDQLFEILPYLSEEMAGWELLGHLRTLLLHGR